MMNKTKKFLAVFTLICLMCSFVIIPVNAEAGHYKKLILDKDLNEDLTTQLFPPESMALYPGESVESAILIENDTDSLQMVNIKITKGTKNEKDLANFIDLIITRDGESGEIYNGKIGSVDKTVENIEFPVDSTGIYRFKAIFNPADSKYMGGTADFTVVFTAEAIGVNPTDPPPPPYPEEEPEDDPVTPPDEDEGGDIGGGEPPAATIPTAGEAPAQAAAPSAIISNENEEAPPQATGEAPEEIPEEDIGENDVPFGGANPDEPEPETEPASEQSEDFEDFEENEVPLAEYIDKMPQTGETTDPSLYLMIGLTFVLAGSAVIIIANKKAKAK